MDAKLQVILKGILVTKEDGVNFSGFLLGVFSLPPPKKNHLLIICMSSRDH